MCVLSFQRRGSGAAACLLVILLAGTIHLIQPPPAYLLVAPMAGTSRWGVIAA